MSFDVLRAITSIYFLTNVLTSTVSSQEEEKHLYIIKKDYGEHVYILIKPKATTRLSWYQADKECRTNEALLTSIANQAENEFLSEITPSKGESCWIGLSALNEWDDYQWIDRTPQPYENWLTGSFSDRVKREKCVKIELDSGKWVDGNCEESAGAICKKRKVGKEDLHPLPIMPSKGNCPLDWRPFDNKCYKIMDRAENWTTAKEVCRSLGGNHDLMSVHRTAENMFLTSFLTNDTWIGGASLKRENRPGWSDNSPFDYNQLGEEIDWEGKCVQVLADELNAGTWEAISCSEERTYACQRYVDPLIHIGPTIAPPKCDNERYQLVGYRDNCYLVIKDEKKSWVEAEKFCETIGAHLASVGNVFEGSFIFSYLYPLPDDVWIGLRSKKGLFRWLETWPLRYTNWMKDHPLTIPEEMPCVVLDMETQQWKAENCTNQHGFLCKLSDEEPTEVEKYEGVCPDHMKDGIDLQGRYCYRIYGSDRKTNWTTAQQNCREYETTLASFHSPEELNLLGPHLKDLKSAWIGLHKSDDGVYKWADASPVDFVFWEETVASDQKCVAISESGLTWQGVSCSQQKPFVCAAPKVQRTKEEEKNGKEGGKGLSSGAVAGIVIAVLLAIPGLACFGYYLWKNNKLDSSV